MAPSAALGHVSHVLTCLVHQHAHFEDDVTPPKLVTSAAIPEEVSTRVRRLFPEEVTSELSRLRRWLPSFADGDRVTWGDVADCLLDAIDALPASAARPRAQGELFANLVLSDAVASPPMGNVQKFPSGADVKPRHARLLLDGGSDVTLATLVAAGHITAANRALMNKLAETKDWDERLALVSAAARWEWGGDGTRRVGRAACAAAAAALRFVLDEMIKPASHGAQRRPLALALTTILRSLARGGGDAASVALLPLDDVVDVASSWSQKGNAAAENSALLQSVTALQRRRGGKRAEEELALDAAVRRALLAGLQADKEESKKEALECLVAALGPRASREPKARSVSSTREHASAPPTPTRPTRPTSTSSSRAPSPWAGRRVPPPQLWGRTERAMAAAARVDPATAVDVAGEMLGAARERAGSKAAKIQGAGSVNARVVALRFVSWALGTREDSDDSECSRADDRAPAAATAETWRRSAALAPAIAAALTLPKPSRSSVTRRDADTDRITYVASGSKPDAPSGDATEVMLVALRCSPLLLSAARARGGVERRRRARRGGRGGVRVRNARGGDGGASRDSSTRQGTLAEFASTRDGTRASIGGVRHGGVRRRRRVDVPTSNRRGGRSGILAQTHGRRLLRRRRGGSPRRRRRAARHRAPGTGGARGGGGTARRRRGSGRRRRALRRRAGTRRGRLRG